MPGIAPSVIVHKLNDDPSYKLVQEKQRGYLADKSQATTEQVKKNVRSQVHKRYVIYDLVGRRCLCKKVKQKMEDVR